MLRDNDLSDQPFGLPRRLYCKSPRFKETGVEVLKAIKEVEDPKKPDSKKPEAQPDSSNGSNLLDEFSDKPVDQRYGDIAAIKVIELSKKIRDLSSSLAHEQNKSRRFAERIKTLEIQLREQSNPIEGSTKRTNSNTKPSEHECEACKSVKSLQEKLSKAEQALNDLKDQNHLLDGDLKLARKVLELETGETIPNLGVWLRNLQMGGETTKGKQISVGWRGRQQQIVLLKTKVKNLEAQIGKMTLLAKPSVEFAVEDDGGESSGATSFGASELDFLDDKQTGHITSRWEERNVLSRSRNLIAESQAEKENETLRSELSIMKTKLKNAKSREKTATSEFTELKKQLQWVLEKGKHDDELIESLLQNKAKLQTAIEQEVSKQMEVEQQLKEATDQASSLRVQRDTLQQQYQEILDQKNDRITELDRINKELISKLNEVECDKSQCTNLEKTDQNSEEKNLSKQIELLTIERDGLRQLVETLNNQLDRQIHEITELERKNAETDRCNTASTLGSRKTPKHVGIKSANEKRVPDDRLCSREYLQKVINDASLSMAAANLVSKRIEELQSALGSAKDEIKGLNSMTKRLKEARKEDFTILTQIITQLRSSCSEE